jgi:hypothetical protein
MNDFKGKALSWTLDGGIVEVELHYAPCNEIGIAMLEDLEQLVQALPQLESQASAKDFPPAAICANSIACLSQSKVRRASKACART